MCKMCIRDRDTTTNNNDVQTAGYQTVYNLRNKYIKYMGWGVWMSKTSASGVESLKLAVQKFMTKKEAGDRQCQTRRSGKLKS